MYAQVIPETPMTTCIGKHGTRHLAATPYTLVVPPAFLEAINPSILAYSWAQSLLVALHSMRLAFENHTGCERMPLEEVAQQLD